MPNQGVPPGSQIPPSPSPEATSHGFAAWYDANGFFLPFMVVAGVGVTVGVTGAACFCGSVIKRKISELGRTILRRGEGPPAPPEIELGTVTTPPAEDDRLRATAARGSVRPPAGVFAPAEGDRRSINTGDEAELVLNAVPPAASRVSTATTLGVPNCSGPIT
jgi:hypothetical protein